MNTTKYIGLIECGTVTSGHPSNQFPTTNGYAVKKVLVTAKSSAAFLQEQYPEAELVHDKEAIIGDSTIDLVIVSGSQTTDLPMIKEALQAGKNVRMLDQYQTI